MNWIINLLLLALIVVGVLPFISLGPNGDALLELPNLEFPDVDVKKAFDLLDGQKPDLGSERSATVYKWHDSGGQTHYTNDPPPQGVQAELVSVHPDTNVVPAVDPPVSDDHAAVLKEQEVSAGSVYSPNNIQRLMDNARNVQNILNDRAEEMRKLSDK